MHGIKITDSQIAKANKTPPRRSDYEERHREEEEKRIRAYRKAIAPELNYKFNKDRSVYANEEEKKRMYKANPKLIAQMTKFMECLPTMQTKKALEVACGECMVSRDILLD